MINKIIQFSVKNRWMVLLLAILTMVAGWIAFENLTIDAVPDITNVQVSVSSVVEGLVPEEIERVITYPIEAAVNGIAKVTHIRSLSKFGLSQVTVNFEDGTDIYWARQQVAERLSAVLGELPKGVQPKLGPISTGLGEIFMYTVESDTPLVGPERKAQLMELRAIQEWVIRPRLMTVQGVAGVDTTGGYEKQYHIQPNIKTMRELGLSFEDLHAALEASNKNVGGGYIEQGKDLFLVQAVGLFASADDIRRVPVKILENLRVVTIGDIATVTVGSGLRVGAALVSGKEAILGTVFLLMGENSRVVAKRVAERFDEIKKNLPQGIKIETLYNRAEVVDATLDTVIHNLLMGAILVVIILLLFLGNLRAAVITAITIPFALLFTFLLMKARGISGNLMSLGALDFGIIVDGAVIVMDNCVRVAHERIKGLGRALTRSELQETVVHATIETRKAAGFGELIIVLVLLPIFALTGIEGKMFKPMIASFCFALLGALIFSFTAAPALASLFLSGKVAENEPWLMRKARDAYHGLLFWSLSHRKYVLSGVGIILIVGFALFARLGAEFVPQLNEGSIVVMLQRDVNISMTEAVRMQEESEKLIMDFPEVAKVFSRTGTAEAATDPMGIYQTDTFVMLKPKKDWPKVDGRRRGKDELAEAIAEKLRKEMPDQEPILTQPIQMRFNELMEGTRADIAVKIFGDDLEQLLEQSEKAETILKKIPGAGDVEAEISEKAKLLRITPNHTLLEKMGIPVQAVLDTTSTAIGGLEAGTLYEGVRRFPIVIRANEQERSDPEVIKTLPVSIGPYLNVRIAEVADVAPTESFGLIIRENAKRRAAILVNPRGRDTESFVMEARATLEKEIPLQAGSYFEWGGNFKNLEKAKARLMLLMPLVLLLVLVMIYVVFRNLFQTLLIFSGVPLAMVGGIVMLLITGLPFSISAGVGFIALSGIAILNGVVLISYINLLRQETGHSGVTLVFQGCLMRLRPVLMTALVEIFGFLPMMFSTGLGAEVQRPLATVVIGGVFSSTLLTLVVLPLVYLMFEGRSRSQPE
ncbi:MAG: CusA/CzcA family heavy metal efflux RND transporter [Deltaproteobacteria bacterium CG11_big_fil_rev_8_21_14_0_20_47_16]|nr:MAG: CusA/CzcA family heavy metal efflux RND transporter [Deltaproteobacteria bacterium CG11_big_fil_rev_8_21_14_0_20_47_16]